MISSEVVIITRAELKGAENAAFQKGVARGRFEERAEYPEGRSGGLETDETLLVRARKLLDKHLTFSVFADGHDPKDSRLAEQTGRLLAAEIAALAMSYHVTRTAADRLLAPSSAEAERASVVAWLRAGEWARSYPQDRGIVAHIIDCIERGDHLKPEVEGG